MFKQNQCIIWSNDKNIEKRVMIITHKALEDINIKEGGAVVVVLV